MGFQNEAITEQGIKTVDIVFCSKFLRVFRFSSQQPDELIAVPLCCFHHSHAWAHDDPMDTHDDTQLPWGHHGSTAQDITRALRSVGSQEDGLRRGAATWEERASSPKWSPMFG